MHIDSGCSKQGVLRTTKLLTKVAIRINISRYTWQIFILFDLNIMKIRVSEYHLMNKNILLVQQNLIFSEKIGEGHIS